MALVIFNVCWMLRIRPTETPALMTAADYRSQLEG